ncbi:MAG TPA: DUF2269 family protein [Actinomycetota bacterium]|nr:DUF2269 family protein [Actinomycetota bacterium]
MLYDWLLVIHILAAILWIGGGVMLHLIFVRTRSAGDASTMARLLTNGEWLGKAFFGPISGVLLLAGIALVLKGPWQFNMVWVILGLVGFAASGLLGAVFLQTPATQLQSVLAEKGFDDPQVKALSDRVFLLSRIDFAILVLVVIDMTIKPWL